MKIEHQSQDHARAIAAYYWDNREHLEPWEPNRPEGFYTATEWAKRLHCREIEQAAGRGAYFVGLEPNEEEPGTPKVVAACSLTSITRGAFQACFMGYSVDRHYEGRGYMRKLCLHAIDYAFKERGLNRIMANYMPHNHRSERLLEGLGFAKEGYAHKYLYINGRWEDHVLTSLVNPQNR